MGNPNILVIGAGASGLAFALACAHQGVRVRIIDCRPTRSMIEKATGVAQGVWIKLALYGITSAVIADAIPMRHFVFHDDGKLIADVPVPLLDGNPPAHLYPQGALEHAMENALASYGVTVEYGTTFKSIEQSEVAAKVVLRREPESSIETVDADWVIGADGAHSAVRKAIGLPFYGRDYPEDWSVAEVETSQWPNNIQAQLFLQSSGVGLFISQPSPGVIQGILNAPGAASELKSRYSDSKLRYERDFRVSLRRVPTPRLGRVWVIGDAAHIQSPVGGQGLNLAIWDGVTLGESLIRGNVAVENRLASRARRVLFFTDFDYRMLASKSKAIRLARNHYWSFASRYPLAARWFFKIISGVW